MDPKAFEALQEKIIAEKMMINNCYLTAREKLLKAHELNPEIENIGPMIAVCDILSASSIKFPGLGVDHYWVLQLSPSSTFSDVESCYQKFVTMLRPFRYKFPGTESALKLIQDAFAVLSNRIKRSSFDSKRVQSWECYKCFTLQSLSQEILLSNKETITNDPSSSKVNGESSNQVSGEENGVNCGEPEDKDTPADSMNISSMSIKRSGQDFYNFENDRKSDLFETGDIWAAHFRSNMNDKLRYAQVYDKLESSVYVKWLKPVPITAGERRWCDAGLPVACGSFELDSDTTDTENWPAVSSHKCSFIRGAIDEQLELYPTKGEIWAVYKDWSLEEWAYNPKTFEGCKVELVEMLSTFSKYLGANGACLVKVDGFKSVYRRQTIGGSPVIVNIPPDNLYMFSHQVPAYPFYGWEIEGVANGMFELDQLALPNDTKFLLDSQATTTVVEERISRSFFSTPMQPLPLNSTSTSWSPNDFATGQIWAVYSGNDFMPRTYARINKVLSPRQVHVTYLDTLHLADFDINSTNQKLPFVCGLFRVSEASINMDLSKFSHIMKCQKSTSRAIYKIYPMKGEIWAVYKNWNNKWRSTDYENSQCGIVEIISDFSEENGISVVKLTEVKGCLTFFDREQYDGFDLSYVVSKSKMLSFSHRIPSFKVPGIGCYGIPETSWHLEPNALP